MSNDQVTIPLPVFVVPLASVYLNALLLPPKGSSTRCDAAAASPLPLPGLSLSPVFTDQWHSTSHATP